MRSGRGTGPEKPILRKRPAAKTNHEKVKPKESGRKLQYQVEVSGRVENAEN